MRNLDICFCFNDNYTVPAAIAFYSLLESASEDVFYTIYVLGSCKSDQNIKLLKTVISKFQNRAELIFIDTDDFFKNKYIDCNFNTENGAFTYDILARCFLELFFPDKKKIIYSDVDVIFRDDISELYDLDLEDYYLAAVRGAFNQIDNYHEINHLSSDYLEKYKEFYSAGGIWVVNIQKAIADNLTQTKLDILINPEIYKRWPDQDLMNLAVKDKIKFIPLNFISYPYLLKSMRQDNFCSYYSSSELYDSIMHPKIIHFAYLKPWFDSNIVYADLWWAYYFYLDLEKYSVSNMVSYGSLSNEQRKILNEIKKLNKKLKKYRKLTSVLSVLFFIFIILIALVHIV